MKSPADLHLDDVLARLSPLHRDLVCSMARGDVDADELFARRYGVSTLTIRRERILARSRLRDLLGGSASVA